MNESHKRRSEICSPEKGWRKYFLLNDISTLSQLGSSGQHIRCSQDASFPEDEWFTFEAIACFGTGNTATKNITFFGQLTYRNVNVHTVLFNVPSQQSQVELFCPSFLRNFQCKESSEGISNAKKGRICNAKKKLKDGSHLKLLWTLCCCLFRKRDDQNSALQKSQNFKWWMSWLLIWCAWTRTACIVWNSLY